MSENTTPAGETAVPEGHTVDAILNGIGYDGFVRALFNRSGDFSKDFAHAVLGISTEVYELRHATDKVNQTEEAGDLLFYSTALMQVVHDLLGEPVEDLLSLPLQQVGQLIAGRVGPSGPYIDQVLNQLQDDAKRWVGYDRAPADPKLSLAKGLLVVCVLLEDCGCDDNDELQRVNIAKLLKRYKGLKFTSEAAINRDVAAERSVMEHAGA